MQAFPFYYLGRIHRVVEFHNGLLTSRLRTTTSTKNNIFGFEPLINNCLRNEVY